MNSVYDRVDNVAKNANRFNLDDVLAVLVECNHPEEVRKGLQTIYFHATEALFANNGETCMTNDLLCGFVAVRDLIESLETVNDTNSAKLAVTIK